MYPRTGNKKERKGLTEVPQIIEPPGLSRKTLCVYYQNLQLNYQELHTHHLRKGREKKTHPAFHSFASTGFET